MIIQNSLQYIAIAVKWSGRLSMYKEQLEVTAVDTQLSGRILIDEQRGTDIWS